MVQNLDHEKFLEFKMNNLDSLGHVGFWDCGSALVQNTAFMSVNIGFCKDFYTNFSSRVGTYSITSQ